MNKRLFLSMSVSLAVMIGLGVYVATLFPANTPTSTSKQPVQKTAKQQTTTVQPGSYQPYDEATFSDFSENRRILFFHAPWCPQCRQLDQQISASQVPDGVSILKVDYDTSQQLRAKYGVTLQTTFVEVDASGNKVKSFVAYDDPTYANLTKSLSF